MNFLVKNRKREPRPVGHRLDAKAKAWLAQFPNNAVAQIGDRGTDRTPVQTSTTLSSFLLNSNNIHEPQVYLAISIGRGNASTEIGLAAIDVQCPSLILSQFSDDLWFNGLMTKISVYTPKQLLLPNTLCDIQPAPKILTFIRNNFPDLKIVPLDRSRFNSHHGIAQLQRVCAAKYAQLLGKNTKLYYTMTSAAALLYYVQHHVVKAQFGANSLRVEFESKSGSMQIDVESAHRLELLYPLYPSLEKRTCLYGVLNTCVTRLGQRNLRAKVLQPSRDLVEIETMHGCVAELRGKDRLIAELQVCLRPFYAVDRLIRIAYVMPQNKEDNYRVSELLINQALQLKSCLDSIPELFQLLSELNGPVFAQIREGLQDTRYPYLAKKIYDVLETNGSASNYGSAQFFQRINAVRTGINGMLDLNRTIYAALVDDIKGEVGRLKDVYNLPLRMSYSKGRGFHVQLPLKGGLIVDRIVAEMEVASKSKTMLLLTNETLCNLNIRIKKYIDEIHFTSTAILGNLLQTVRTEMDIIYDLAGYISELDITMAIVRLSLNPDYSCPKFGDDLRVIQGIHPFLEYASHKTHPRPVPNNVLSTAEYNFFIITGPNMAGKTIYLKMIALLQIMAQIGCYVPAKSAQFRLCDKVFTRMGFNDSIEQNASSFVVEMREMDYILKSITPNSLVIIDELCRSTNIADGQRIAWKICERMIQVNGPTLKNDETLNNHQQSAENALTAITAPFIFFTTHFPELCQLYDRYLNVVNLNFIAIENMTKDKKLHLTYTHELQEGATTIKGYGLALARTVRFPPSIIPRAEELYAYLVRNGPPSNMQTNARPNLVPYSNTSSLPRTRSSNPINRTYTSSSSNLRGNIAQSPADISADTRDVYDLYSNIIDSTKRKEEVGWLDQLNELLGQFLEHCDPAFVQEIRMDSLNDLLDRLSPKVEKRILPRSNGSSSSKHDRSVTFSEKVRFKNIVAYDCETNQTPQNLHQDRNITSNLQNTSGYSDAHLARLLSNTSRNESEHSLYSNLIFNERMPHLSTSSSYLSDMQPRIVSSNNCPSNVRSMASDTETNMSGPSFKSFMKGFAPPKKPQITSKPAHPMTERALFMCADEQPHVAPPAQFQARDPCPSSSTNSSSGQKSWLAKGPCAPNTKVQYQRPLQSTSSYPTNRNYSSKKNVTNYFAGVPDDFWESVNEFENGHQYQELKDFINEGIPMAVPFSDSRSLPLFRANEPSAEQHNTSVQSSRSSHKRSVSFADEQLAHQSQNQSALGLLFEATNKSSSSIVCPDLFADLDNFVAQSHPSSSRFSLISTSPAPKRARPNDHNYQDIFHGRSQDVVQPDTQNTINFLVEFESGLTSNTTDPNRNTHTLYTEANPLNEYYHSIFDSTPNTGNAPCPMELDEPVDYHGTQSLETVSSLDEMDPTQNVVTILSQSSSQQDNDEDMFLATPTQPPPLFTPFNFKVPTPLDRSRHADNHRKIYSPTPFEDVEHHFPTHPPPRALLCRSPTQSENKHRLDEYLTSQYERAIVNPVASSDSSSARSSKQSSKPSTSLPEQFPEVSTSFSNAPNNASPRTPPQLQPPAGLDPHSFITPGNRNEIRSIHLNMTVDSVADSLRRYIDSNRDSDEDDEDMFAGSAAQPAPSMRDSRSGAQQRTAPMPDPDSSVVDAMMEIIIPAPDGFQ